MKYCLQSRNIKEYLCKADEIRIEYRDYKSTPDIIENYPTAKIILEEDYLGGNEFNWNDIKIWNGLAQGRLILCLATFGSIDKCREIGVEYFMGYPAKTFYELHGLKAMGVSYIRVDAPAFFKMEALKNEIDIPVRVLANVAYYDNIPRDNGIIGTWIRPEDVELYEPYVDVIEFGDCNNEKEQALYRIYAQEKKWAGPLNTIISNLNAPTDPYNRLMDSEVTKKRLNCGQGCTEGSKCRICYRAVILAQKDRIKDYKESLES